MIDHHINSIAPWAKCWKLSVQFDGYYKNILLKITDTTKLSVCNYFAFYLF